jgi:chaperonin GroES
VLVSVNQPIPKIGLKPGNRPVSRRTRREEETMKIQPLGDRVLVQALEAKEMSKSGIIIPDTAKERPSEGKVIAVGLGRLTEDGERVKPEVSKGDTVLYGKYSGTEVTVDGKEYMILRESDVLAIL